MQEKKRRCPLCGNWMKIVKTTQDEVTHSCKKCNKYFGVR